MDPGAMTCPTRSPRSRGMWGTRSTPGQSREMREGLERNAATATGAPARAPVAVVGVAAVALRGPKSPPPSTGVNPVMPRPAEGGAPEPPLPWLVCQPPLGPRLRLAGALLDARGSRAVSPLHLSLSPRSSSAVYLRIRRIMRMTLAYSSGRVPPFRKQSLLHALTKP
jgi:hypothetical protein